MSSDQLKTLLKVDMKFFKNLYLTEILLAGWLAGWLAGRVFY